MLVAVGANGVVELHSTVAGVLVGGRQVDCGLESLSARGRAGTILVAPGGIEIGVLAFTGAVLNRSYPAQQIDLALMGGMGDGT
jgi:hypothetical protein